MNIPSIDDMNTSPAFWAAVSTLLITQGVPFAFDQGTVVVPPAFQSQFDALCETVRERITEHIQVITDADSEEQSSGFANGTLSNIAPGVALTVQIHPAVQRTESAEVLARLLPAMFYPLSVQGWEVMLVLGDDLDIPAHLSRE